MRTDLGDLAADNELADIIVFTEVKEFLDLGGSLGTQAAGLDGVGESCDLVLALYSDDKIEHRQIGSNNAAAHGFAFASAWNKKKDYDMSRNANFAVISSPARRSRKQE